VKQNDTIHYLPFTKEAETQPKRTANASNKCGDSQA
jgi:hypothetical protein